MEQDEYMLTQYMLTRSRLLAFLSAANFNQVGFLTLLSLTHKCSSVRHHDVAMMYFECS